MYMMLLSDDNSFRVTFVRQPLDELVKNRLARFSVAIVNARGQLVQSSLTLVTTLVYDDGSEVPPAREKDSSLTSPLIGGTRIHVNTGIASFEVKPMVLSGRRAQSRFRVRLLTVTA